MQMVCVYSFVCAGVAWYLSGLFLRLSPKEALFSGGLAGAFCALVSFLLAYAGLSENWVAAVLPLLAFFLPFQPRRNLSAHLLSLPVSLGAWAVLMGGCRLFSSLLPVAVAGLLCCILGTRYRSYAPPENWQEYFGRKEERFPVVEWQVWAVLSLMAVLELALLPGSGKESLPLALVSFAARFSLYWLALYAACLMTAYRREQLTVLIDQDYRNEVQAFMSVIRSQRHDYNFHVQALSGLVQEGDMEACRQYLDAMVQDSIALNTVLPISDPAIGALINSFRILAKEKGIELHLDIQNDLSCVVTSVYETNKIIGNLLQNAIDEVSTHVDKSFGIHLYIVKRGENCIIHVANKVESGVDAQTLVQDVYRPGLTTKTGHEGIGLSSIRQLLLPYRGVVYSRMGEGDDIIHFVAKIPLKLEGGIS